MILDERGLPKLWERIRAYVSEYVSSYDSLATATIYEKGQVRPDGTTITVDDDGTIHGASTYEIASTEDAITGTDDELLMTPLKVAQAIDEMAADKSAVKLDIVTDNFGNRRVAILVRRG